MKPTKGKFHLEVSDPPDINGDNPHPNQVEHKKIHVIKQIHRKTSILNTASVDAWQAPGYS
jgi:hypothetical protein